MLKRKRPDAKPRIKDDAFAPPPTGPQPDKAIHAFETGTAEVLRALKKARGFERQRLNKRIAEEKRSIKKATGRPVRAKAAKAAKAAKMGGASAAAAGNGDEANDGDNADAAGDERQRRLARLERELDVLKTLDCDIAARVHLAHAMLRTRGLATAPGPLGGHLQVEAEVLQKRTQAHRTDDVHNVTSALYNKPFVRDAVAKAVRAMCELLAVPVPERGARGRIRAGDRNNGQPEMVCVEAAGQEDDDDDESDGESADASEEAMSAMSAGGRGTVASQTPGTTKTTLAHTARGGDDDDDDDDDDLVYNEDDDEAIERELAKYDALIGGGSDEDGDSDDDNGDSSNESLDDDDDDEVAVAKLRAKYKAALAAGAAAQEDSASDDGETFEGFSESEAQSESESESESESDEDLRPPKKRAAVASRDGPLGTSHFLPSLMGGYVSDDGSDDDGSVASDEAAAARMLGAARKNRRGQRARQAIWEKKYKAQAKHLAEAEAKQKTGKAGKEGKVGKAGWDAKRGAVDASDAPRWLRRKMGIQGRGGGATGGSGPGGGSGGGSGGNKNGIKNPNANQQVSGPLHPSWEAARKAKEKTQTAPFAGKKITFD